LDIAAFQDVKGALPVSHACEDFARVQSAVSGPKSKKKNTKESDKLNCMFEFHLNCKQRYMFHQGTISDNKFMSVDAAQFQ